MKFTDIDLSETLTRLDMYAAHEGIQMPNH